MADANISRAASIARRLNTPVVIMEEAADPVVIVPLRQYEEMMGGTTGKSLTHETRSATINRDIALENGAPYRPASGSGVSDAQGADEQYYMEPLE